MGPWGFVGLAYGIVWGRHRRCTTILLKAPLSTRPNGVERAQQGGGDSEQCTKINAFDRRNHHSGGRLLLDLSAACKEAIVYFVTPSELKAKESASHDKFLRMGGMVVKGSLQKDLQNLTYRFRAHRRQRQHFRFSSKAYRRICSPKAKARLSKGGSANDGVFQATTIMAKHAEEYSPHADGKAPPIASFPPRKPLQVTATPRPYSILLAFVLALGRDRHPASSRRAPSDDALSAARPRSRSSASSFWSRWPRAR